MQQVAHADRSMEKGRLSERAFADLLLPLIEPGFRLALGMLHDPQAAEDVVQEASLTAWKKVGTLRERDKVRSWFMGVVANQCRNARRQKWKAVVGLGLPENLSVLSAEDAVFRAEDLRRALLGLRHEHRLVVVLYFYLDMPLDEVATTVGISPSAARARLYRAIQ